MPGLNSVYKKTRVCTRETSSLRLAKRQKAEFTGVHEHFWRKRNEKIGVFIQTLNKKLIFKALMMCFILLSGINNSSLLAQNSLKPDDLCGEWWTPDNDGKILFFKEGTTYSGKVTFIRKNIDPETGKQKLDKHNPDPALRNRPVINLVLFYNFRYDNSKGKYADGKLYDSDTGNTYSCWIRLVNKSVLELHGFVGFSLIGKSVYFTRVQ